jgi:hypothetical protein
MLFKSRKLLKEAEEKILSLQNEITLSNAELKNQKTLQQQTANELSACQQTKSTLEKEKAELLSKYSSIIDLDQALQQRQDQIENCKSSMTELNGKYTKALSVYQELEKKLQLYTETLELTEYGLYQPKYSFEFSEQYKLELEHIYQQQKKMISEDRAVICGTQWEIGGSLTEGKKMTKQYTKLMLFGFNGECDANIAKVRWNNVAKIEQRIREAYVTINKLGQTYNISISWDYLQLKLKELSLTYEYEQKKYEEKEEQRRIREQMREEEKAQKEFERMQKEAEEEERKVEKDLTRARQQLEAATGDGTIHELNEKIKQLELSLQQAHEKRERAISMAQLTKVGHIYIISNIGSFGENVYKIGLTRRLDPLDRIRELGDASVPFQFDIHAIIYSENAPQLEYELHQRFKDQRLNRINHRKEFFRTSLEEIEQFIKNHTDADIVFTKLAEAPEYRQTLTLLEQLQNLESNKVSVPEFPGSLIA